MTTISKDLMRHAKALVKQSWAQGDDNVFGAEPKGCCVATACVAASRAIFSEAQSEGVSRDAVLLFKHANGIHANMPMGDWNDASERTKANVLAAFDKAIDAAAAQVPGPPRPRKQSPKPRAPKDLA